MLFLDLIQILYKLQRKFNNITKFIKTVNLNVFCHKFHVT